MANLSDIGRLTGRVSIVEMDRETLLAHFMALRQSRRTSKRVVSPEKVPKKKSAGKKTPLDKITEELTQDQLKELLSKLGG